MRAPRLLTPLFCVLSLRMCREIIAARGSWISGLWFSAQHGIRALTNVFSPTLMARRVRLVETLDLEPEIRRIDRPVLVVTGDPGMDLVVPVHLTREYLRLLPQAQGATIARTGHIGLVTRADVFADLIAGFAGHNVREGDRRRRVG